MTEQITPLSEKKCLICNKKTLNNKNRLRKSQVCSSCQREFSSRFSRGHLITLNYFANMIKKERNENKQTLKNFCEELKDKMGNTTRGICNKDLQIFYYWLDELKLKHFGEGLI